MILVRTTGASVTESFPSDHTSWRLTLCHIRPSPDSMPQPDCVCVSFKEATQGLIVPLTARLQYHVRGPSACTGCVALQASVLGLSVRSAVQSLDRCRVVCMGDEQAAQRQVRSAMDARRGTECIAVLDVVSPQGACVYCNPSKTSVSTGLRRRHLAQ